MNDPLSFFNKVSLMRVECDSCGLVRVLSAQMSSAELRPLQRKAIAAQGWIQMSTQALACHDCTEVLKTRLTVLPHHERLSVQQALAEAIGARRVQVSGQ